MRGSKISRRKTVEDTGPRRGAYVSPLSRCLWTARVSKHSRLYRPSCAIIPVPCIPKLYSHGIIKTSKMRFDGILAVCAVVTSAQGKVFDRQPLSYVEIPEGTYEPPNKSGETTLLDFIKSRDDLTELAKLVEQVPGRSYHSSSSSQS